MALTTKSAIAGASDVANNPAAFAIKTGQIGAFARKADDTLIDLDVRRAEFVQGQRPALLDDSDVMYLSGTASSTVADRMGDILDANCQRSMLEQIRGMTLFLGHEYSVPEDVLGTCVGSSLEIASDRKHGDCLDLNVIARVSSENPRAIKCWRHVQGGVKLGWSIGGIFKDVDFRDEKDWGAGLIVHDIELLETSMVGIPANPRTYTKFVSEMTKDFKANIAIIASNYPNQTMSAAASLFIRKSLLGGVRPEDIRLEDRLSPSRYNAFDVKQTGTREDANDDEQRLTVPENPNATATNDRPHQPKDSPTAQMASSLVGPPIADEPPAVPQVGGPKVVGNNQPQESNPVSIDNSAPYPARFHGDDENDGHQGGPEGNLPSRPQQHAEMGRQDAASGAQVTSAAVAPATPPTASTDVNTPDAAGVPRKPAAAAPAPEPVLAPKPATAPVASAKPAATTIPPATPEKALDEAFLAIKDFMVAKDLVDDNGGATSDTTGAVLQDGQGGLRRKALRAMRAIKSAVTPGMHNESHGHLVRAHAALTSMMGEYELPGDALMSDTGSDVAPQLLRSADELIVKSLEVASEVQRKELELQTISDIVAQKNSEVTDLEKKLADLRATPIGRRSAYPGGSYQLQESEPLVSADMYYRSDYEQTKALNEAAFRNGRSARDQA